MSRLPIAAAIIVLVTMWPIRSSGAGDGADCNLVRTVAT
jgi:hypothetical protein